MKKVIALAATLVASFCMGISVFGATTDYETMNLKYMNLQWSDEFDGTSLNRDYWTPEIGNGFQGWGNNEKEYYMDSENNIQVSDGTLKLIARAENVNGFNYTSARLKTEDKVECGYGYVEARIKLPSITGLWPAFWMLGANQREVGWPKCGEIDILEAWNTGDFAQNCLHYADDNSPFYETETWRSDNWSNYYKVFNIGKTQWHTYGVYKTKDKLVFYIDGKRASRVIDITNPVMSEVHNEFFILLNVACGGNLAENKVPSAADLPGQMEVDYVRYYVDKSAEEMESIKAEEASKLAAEKASKEAAEKASKEAASKEAASKAAAEKKAAEEAKKAPKKASIKSLKNIKGRKMQIKIKKISGAKGYQIRFCDNKKFQGYENKTTKKLKVTIKRLEKKATYWVKVRAYKMVNGKKKYGAWSKVKKVKIKK